MLLVRKDKSKTLTAKVTRGNEGEDSDKDTKDDWEK